MNEADFWLLIEKSKSNTGFSNSTGLLMKQLQRLTPEEIATFFHYYSQSRDALHNQAAWQAANLVTGKLCDSLSFHFFRVWVVSLGRHLFSSVLENPDTLAKVNELFPCGEPESAFDAYNQAPHLAYFSKAKAFLYQAIRQQFPSYIERPLALGPWSPASQKQMADQLPSLWQRKGEGRHPKRGQWSVEEVNVPNIGIIKRGTELIHDHHGLGSVVTVSNCAGNVMAQILFEDGMHPMVLEDVTKWSRP